MSDTPTQARPLNAPPIAEGRVEWVDYAKGICILLVCMMHSTLGVGEAMHGEGFMHTVVAWARPFRMPDFFLLSGLFVASVIDRPWRTYLDRKVVHFVYFYLLWLVIQSLFRYAPAFIGRPMQAVEHFQKALFYPFPPLWFIYVLPIYFVVTKLTRHVPIWGMLGFAALIHTVPLKTGWPAIDVFATHYFVYFLAGYVAAPFIFRFAETAARHWATALACLAVWAVVNTSYAFTASRFEAYPVLADLPFVSIMLGLLGALAVVTTASLLAKFRLASFIKYCGANSIVIYVAFMLPMALSRVALIKLGLITNIGVVSVLVMTIAALVPLALHRAVKGTAFRFLFERPKFFSIEFFERGWRSRWIAAPAVTAPVVTARVPATAPPPPQPAHAPEEIQDMARRTSFPPTIREHKSYDLPSGRKLKPANQNVPARALFERNGKSSERQSTPARDIGQRLPRFSMLSLDSLKFKTAEFARQIRDTVTGKPEVVEPAVMVELSPDRLAKAIRRPTTR
jgi:uncharacterized membrane protein YcfT